MTERTPETVDIVERLKRLRDYKTMVSVEFAERYGTVEERAERGEYKSGFDVAFRQELTVLEEAVTEITRLRAQGEHHRKRVQELEKALGKGDPIGLSYALNLAAHIIQGTVPKESVDCEGLADDLAKHNARIRAALTTLAAPCGTAETAQHGVDRIIPGSIQIAMRRNPRHGWTVVDVEAP